VPEVVLGLQEALQLLTDAPLNVSLLGFSRAGRAAINVVAAGLVERTPIGEGATRGDLVRSLKVGVTVDTAARGVTAYTGFDGEQGAIAYAVEYGHELLSHEFKLIGQVPEHPFIRPTFDATADAAVQVFADTLTSELKKIYG
jgi:hypothetical protein